jgi:NAD(P)-dependent dehydrogenase (short-subunit alcohol dehydrogenase family)
LHAGAAYTANKHGLVGLTKSTAAFYHRKGIRCNALKLSGMNSNISDAMRGAVHQEGFEIMQRLSTGLGIQTLLGLEDDADLAVYVTNDESAKIVNGALIRPSILT